MVAKYRRSPAGGPSAADAAGAAEAGRSAEAWASKAGVEVDLVADEPSARQAVGVLARIWPQEDGAPPLTPELAWALAHSGNYVAVARSGGDPVGAAAGFLARDEAGPHLHSHIAGVLPTHQGASVGFALKQHQRAWALAGGLDRITWTFDPLIVRNAYFNVMKLGARLTRYYVDFYGPLTDGINAGDQTDRCLVTWDLAADRTFAAAAGEVAEPDLAALASAEAAEVLVPGPDGGPLASADDGARVRLVRVPGDIVAVRKADPALARRWRKALRVVMVEAFHDGLEVAAVTRDGCYVLS